MSKSAYHHYIPELPAELPAELAATPSSSELIRAHLARSVESGVTRASIAIALGFQENNLSNFATGKRKVPLGRVIALAAALGLDDSQTIELLNARMVELHGHNSDLCLHTLAIWATSLVQQAPCSDESFLAAALAKAKAPAPHIDNILNSPQIRAHLEATIHNAVQEELARMAS